jgi:cysteine-S-conjugate beta-lyase
MVARQPGRKRNDGVSVNDKDTKPATRLVQGGRRKDWTGPIVNPPIHRASTILYDDAAALKRGGTTNEDGHFFYGRRGTPTQWALAEAITDLEPGAAGTMLFPSGVAAVSAAMLALLKPGDHVLMIDSAYDPTRSFCDGYLKRWAVETEYYDPMIGGGIDAVCRVNTALIFLESPGSHTFEVQDLPAIVAVAKERGIATIIDNTWATPLYLTTIDKGVDMSVCVATKYLGGHSDVMLGAVTANAATYPALRSTAQAMGQYVSPDDAWLVLRGMRTLDVRMRQQGETSLTVANWLAEQPEIARVLHPALPGCPGHDHWQRDFTGATGLFGAVFAGGTDTARAAFIDALSLFGIGYSWGGFESLIVPSDPARYRTATTWVSEGPMVRLSIGLEHADDLIADLEKGLAAWRAAVTSCG